MTEKTTQPLVVVSSKTGNTMTLAHALCDAFPDAVLVRADALPEDLSGFEPVFLGFWCDRGMAPEDMTAAAKKVSGKRIGCFATLGGNPEDPKAQAWMRKTAESLVGLGGGNSLEALFLCRGRIDPAIFEQMTKMTGGEPSPEREARRQASETHPDRLDLIGVAAAFRSAFGAQD